MWLHQAASPQLQFSCIMKQDLEPRAGFLQALCLVTDGLRMKLEVAGNRWTDKNLSESIPEFFLRQIYFLEYEEEKIPPNPQKSRGE